MRVHSSLDTACRNVSTCAHLCGAAERRLLFEMQTSPGGSEPLESLRRGSASGAVDPPWSRGEQGRGRALSQADPLPRCPPLDAIVQPQWGVPSLPRLRLLKEAATSSLAPGHTFLPVIIQRLSPCTNSFRLIPIQPQRYEREDG